jgi:hypothetical protein
VSLAAALLVVFSAVGQEETAPAWLTFDVLNPDSVSGHRILHLEDVLQPKKAGGSDAPVARAVLMVAVTLDECVDPARAGSMCVRVGTLAEEARPIGGLVIGVLLDSADAVARARKEVPSLHRPFPIAQDGHGITRHALKLDRPGEILVINSLGRFVRFSQPSESGRDLERKLDEARRAFLAALKRDREDEQ